ncbi:MAG: F0F1 ATP synthase subunit B [Clostridia bacterium]|nr:F0F1 ATP synthase subunit B [Clostridia bacterium]
MQSLEVFSLNLWQMIISLCNLIILFLILKKFLYKPVRRALEERKQAVEGVYADARKALDTANASKTEYERELAGIRERADSMLASATADANKRSEAILSDARERADGMMRQAKNDISLERRKAESGIRSEIADVSTALTEKLLAREINSDDHRKLIDDFLDEMEDGNDADE